MILIVDFGSQTAHLIGRRLRQLGVDVNYVIPEETLQFIQNKLKSQISRFDREARRANPKLQINGIILSGGPSSVYEQGAPTIDAKIFTLGIPILAICYGAQLMAKLLGGSVKSGQKEYGPQQLSIKLPQHIFDLPKSKFSVIMSHGDSITELPQGFIVHAETQTVPYAGIVNQKKQLYGVLFHPEATHTQFGLEILKNFVQKICKEKLNPLEINPTKLIAQIKQTVGNQKVICAVSGGVDSTVAAYLIGRAIGKNLIPVFVDSGLMRDNARKRVEYIFNKLIKADLVIIDVQKWFLQSLRSITDPEMKRKMIGKLYIDIFDEVAGTHPDATFLGQGTIYSDVIESKGSKHASHIKSHHNVGGLPKDLKLTLLEPLRNFYKDEVRELGRLAGLTEEIVMEQPFPGPGYAVHIRGEVTQKRLQQVKQADDILTEELKKAKLYKKAFQSFPVMTGAFSTAVKGDGRAFAEVVAIRVYESEDIMTANWMHIPHTVLERISTRIVNEVPDISRVVYDITSKPPATMTWE